MNDLCISRDIAHLTKMRFLSVTQHNFCAQRTKRKQGTKGISSFCKKLFAKHFTISLKYIEHFMQTKYRKPNTKHTESRRNKSAHSLKHTHFLKHTHRICIINSKTILNLMVVNFSSFLLFLLFVILVFQHILRARPLLPSYSKQALIVKNGTNWVFPL